jgi:pimeloyl-ACP methyl ester carboxylesterase
MSRSAFWIVGLVAAVGVGCSGAAPRVASVRGAVIDGLVEVEPGTALHIHCVGQGSPTVIFDAGAGGDGGSWYRVLRDVGSSTRACVYDRAGRMYSSPLAKSHTSHEIVAQLHSLLERAQVPAPYVLVGHSFGGLDVRLYASEHPTEVAGMVLVDASSDTRELDLFNERKGLKLAPSSKPPGYFPPPEIDDDAFTESRAQVRASKLRQVRLSSPPATPPLDAPLIVLSRGKLGPLPPWIPESYGPDLMSLLVELQTEMAHLSSNSVRIVASESSHDIPEDAPHLVVASVRAVVEAARSHARIDASGVLGLPGAAQGTNL